MLAQLQLLTASNLSMQNSPKTSNKSKDPNSHKAVHTKAQEKSVLRMKTKCRFNVLPMLADNEHKSQTKYFKNNLFNSGALTSSLASNPPTVESF